MWQLAQKYKDRIQFVFKPHPLLKVNLYNAESWGKKRTDEYYKLWEDGINTSIVGGEYVDLFNSSDAMIHDCASFMLEYLYQKKPVLYLANNNRQKDSTEAALKAYAAHYKAETEEDIDKFLQDVVLDGKDILFEERENVYENVLLPPNGKSAAENIIYDIKSAIQK